MKTILNHAARAGCTWEGWRRNYIAGIYVHYTGRKKKPGNLPKNKYSRRTRVVRRFF